MEAIPITERLIETLWNLSLSLSLSRTEKEAWRKLGWIQGVGCHPLVLDGLTCGAPSLLPKELGMCNRIMVFGVYSFFCHSLVNSFIFFVKFPACFQLCKEATMRSCLVWTWAQVLKSKSAVDVVGGAEALRKGRSQGKEGRLDCLITPPPCRGFSF